VLVARLDEAIKAFKASKDSDGSIEQLKALSNTVKGHQKTFLGAVKKFCLKED